MKKESSPRLHLAFVYRVGMSRFEGDFLTQYRRDRKSLHNVGTIHATRCYLFHTKLYETQDILHTSPVSRTSPAAPLVYDPRLRDRWIFETLKKSYQKHYYVMVICQRVSQLRRKFSSSNVNKNMHDWNANKATNWSQMCLFVSNKSG